MEALPPEAVRYNLETWEVSGGLSWQHSVQTWCSVAPPRSCFINCLNVSHQCLWVFFISSDRSSEPKFHNHQGTFSKWTCISIVLSQSTECFTTLFTFNCSYTDGRDSRLLCCWVPICLGCLGEFCNPRNVFRTLKCPPTFHWYRWLSE